MSGGYYTRDGSLKGLGQLADRMPLRHPLAAAADEASGMSPLMVVHTVGSVAATPVLAYHGYKRNKSIGWALVWGIFGPIVWPITVPIAFAQGFAKPRAGITRNRRRRRTSRRTSRRRR